MMLESLRRGGAVTSRNTARSRRIKLAMLMPSWPLAICPEQRYRALAARAVRWRQMPLGAAAAFLAQWRQTVPAARRAALIARMRTLARNLAE